MIVSSCLCLLNTRVQSKHDGIELVLGSESHQVADVWELLGSAFKCSSVTFLDAIVNDYTCHHQHRGLDHGGHRERNRPVFLPDWLLALRADFSRANAWLLLLLANDERQALYNRISVLCLHL